MDCSSIIFPSILVHVDDDDNSNYKSIKISSFQTQLGKNQPRKEDTVRQLVCFLTHLVVCSTKKLCWWPDLPTGRSRLSLAVRYIYRRLDGEKKRKRKWNEEINCILISQTFLSILSFGNILISQTFFNHTFFWSITKTTFQICHFCFSMFPFWL